MRLIHSCFCLTYLLPCPFRLRAASCLVCISAYICVQNNCTVYVGPIALNPSILFRNCKKDSQWVSSIWAKIKVASERNSNTKAWRDNGSLILNGTFFSFVYMQTNNQNKNVSCKHVDWEILIQDVGKEQSKIGLVYADHYPADIHVRPRSDPV